MNQEPTPAPELIVDVTQDDIDNGIPGSGSSCPIARAVMRTTDAICVGVDTAILALSTNTDDRYYPMTKRGQRFINYFDDGLPVQPTRLRFTRGTIE